MNVYELLNGLDPERSGLGVSINLSPEKRAAGRAVINAPAPSAPIVDPRQSGPKVQPFRGTVTRPVTESFTPYYDPSAIEKFRRSQAERAAQVAQDSIDTLEITSTQKNEGGDGFDVEIEQAGTESAAIDMATANDDPVKILKPEVPIARPSIAPLLIAGALAYFLF